MPSPEMVAASGEKEGFQPAIHRVSATHLGGFNTLSGHLGVPPEVGICTFTTSGTVGRTEADSAGDQFFTEFAS